MDDKELIRAVAAMCADPLWRMSIAPNLACSEAMLFTSVMEAAGRSEAEIQNFVWDHAAGDDDEMDEHHNAWLARHRRTA
jgi:hypothetical protein